MVFHPLGRETSRVGLGCGTLVGRGSLRKSARLIEAALDLGIRYFDTAPMYGMGTSEEVLGAVLKGIPDVVIATKVGIARPPYSPLKAIMRRASKVILDRSRQLRTAARRAYHSLRRRSEREIEASGIRHLTASHVRQSLCESCALLERSSVDVYLVHEPTPDDLASTELVKSMEDLVAEGLIGCFGAGISACDAPSHLFGSVWQSAWPPPESDQQRDASLRVYHGVLRGAARDSGGRFLKPPPTLLREAMEGQSESLILVAASTPEKLRELVSDVTA